MPIQDLTDYNEIDSQIHKAIRRAEKALMRTLKYCAETVVNTAKDRNKANTFKSQTGNLVSSMGAIIAIDGKVKWRTSFGVEKQGAKGAKEGLSYAKELVRQYPQGIVLIVVAGKNYAKHVSNRGYDVLDSAKLEAEDIIPELISQL